MTDAIDARVELSALRKQAREARRIFARSSLGPFAKAMIQAMGEYDNARTNGVSRDDACRGLEAVLRDAWPKHTSKFTPACLECADTGYRELTCWDRHQCGREKCARHPELTHLYVVPCGCSAGNRMRKRVRSAEDALTSAGKTTKKRGGFSRMGQ